MSMATFSEAQINKKTILIGKDFHAWQSKSDWQNVDSVYIQPENQQLLGSAPGFGVLVNGKTGFTEDLVSKVEFGDVRAHIEFKVAKGSNSGVYFMGRYEIQVFDSWGKEKSIHSDCGGIYQRWDDKRVIKGYEGHSPRCNASFKPGEWQTFDVIFKAPRFNSQGDKIANAEFVKVVHNGKVIHENVQLTGTTRAATFQDEKAFGPLMLQGDHGPVAYRNVWLAPIKLNDFFAMDTGTKDAKHQTYDSQVKMINELGYSGIDHLGFKGIEDKIAAVDKHNSRLFAMYFGISIDHEKPQDIEEIHNAMKYLQGRETIICLFVNSKKYGISDPAGDADAVRIIHDLADNAAKYGLKIVLYPHINNWLEKVEDAIRIIKQINRKNVGITFNLCHWLRTEDQKKLNWQLSEAIPHLSMVTINGAESDGKDWQELIRPLDSGTFDIYMFLKRLKQFGYNGPIGLQGYGIGGDVHQNLLRSIEAWQRLVDPLIDEN